VNNHFTKTEYHCTNDKNVIFYSFPAQPLRLFVRQHQQPPVAQMLVMHQRGATARRVRQHSHAHALLDRNWRYRYVNREYISFSGRPADQILGHVVDLGSAATAINRLFAPGTLRFGELERAVAGVTQKMLIQQLRELERDGSLTPLGERLCPAC
jgi:hypothetical protein